MVAANKINLKKVSAADPKLPEVMNFSMGSPTEDKILEIISTYHDAGNELIGAFLEGGLIGVVGLLQSTEKITIRHISVLPEFQRQGVGTLLLDYVKEHYSGHKIIAETDGESVVFYLKSGFSCNSFEGKYENLRYSCEFGSQ